MAFSIRTVLDSLVTLESGLTITSPLAASVSRVYRLPPTGTIALEPICFMNSADLIAYKVFNASTRERIYSVRMQLFVQDADWDRAGDIALAFQDKLGAALDAQDALWISGVPTCSLWRNLTGGPRVLSWNKVDMPGLDMRMDVVLGAEVPGT